MPKISKAGRRLLETISDYWEEIPVFGDTRPRDPLIRSGYVETRQFDLTPDDLKNGPVRFIRQEWRRTDKGRAIL